ncbi:MAG: winged helix-turn-helix domain-containing protein, partial [Acidobacteriota bacterium]
MTDVSKRLVAFGVYEVDLASGELRRQGRLVRLQQQPFEVLRALVERPGDLVTRDELQRRLWPDGVTVEFETALNKSVAKLRDALGDVADNPRFIETLPKRGYRFIAPVRSGSAPVDTGASPRPAAPADPPAAAAGTAAARNPGWRRRRAVLAAAA